MVEYPELRRASRWALHSGVLFGLGAVGAVLSEELLYSLVAVVHALALPDQPSSGKTREGSSAGWAVADPTKKDLGDGASEVIPGPFRRRVLRGKNPPCGGR